MSENKAIKFIKNNTMLIALIVVIIFFAVSTDGKLLLPQNINNLISQNGYVFVTATGMLLCILTGGNIDLGVGSVIAFTGGIGAVMMDSGKNSWLAVIVMLVVGLIVGLWNGFWIAYIKVPPFIATLASMYAFRGLSNVVMEGYTVAVNDLTFLNVFGGGADCYIPDFLGNNSQYNRTCMIVGIAVAALVAILTFTGRARKASKGYTTAPFGVELIKTIVICGVVIWLAHMLSQYKGIPTALVWIAVVFLAYNYVTTKTTMGRYLYAVGGNEKATRLSGIDTRKVYLYAYAHMGFLTGLAGVLVAARMKSAAPTYGQGYEMDAIGACFVGGASAYGGIGNIGGVIVGATLMGIINQGMSIMGVNANYQKVVKGVVLLIAVVVDVLSKQEKK